MKIIAGLFISAALAIASGCAKTDWIDRTLVTVDVTGTWYGTVGAPSGGVAGTFELWLDLEQNGQTVKGSSRVTPSQTAGGVGPIVGTVAGDVFRFRGERGQAEGELTVSGDEMTGTVTILYGSRSASLRRTNPSSPPASPPR
jgi:hypothetical protein